MTVYRRNIAALSLVLAGLVLRGLIPDGYMPAPAGSPTLFELCPDQAPGLFLATPSQSQHAHHGHHDAPAADDSLADTCDFAALALIAVSIDSVPDLMPDPIPAVPAVMPRLPDIASRPENARRARAPPA